VSSKVSVSVSISACACAVRRASQLPAASDEHLVRTADGLHAVAESLEEVAAVDRLRTADAFILHRLYDRARLQGPMMPKRPYLSYFKGRETWSWQSIIFQAYNKLFDRSKGIGHCLSHNVTTVKSFELQSDAR